MHNFALLRRVTRFLVTLAPAALLGACSLHPFSYNCKTDVQCGANGMCIDGECAFPAATCPSGYQFDKSAKLAGQCVPNSAPDGGADDLGEHLDADTRHDLAPIVFPPAPVWLSSGGGSATGPASQDELNLSVGGVSAVGSSKGPVTGRNMTFGYFCTDSIE